MHIQKGSLTTQETERLMTDSPPGISAAPNNDNLRHFDVTVTGPESSPYEGELGKLVSTYDAMFSEMPGRESTVLTGGRMGQDGPGHYVCGQRSGP